MPLLYQHRHCLYLFQQSVDGKVVQVQELLRTEEDQSLCFRKCNPFFVISKRATAVSMIVTTTTNRTTPQSKERRTTAHAVPHVDRLLDLLAMLTAVAAAVYNKEIPLHTIACQQATTAPSTKLPAESTASNRIIKRTIAFWPVKAKWGILKYTLDTCVAY